MAYVPINILTACSVIAGWVNLCSHAYSSDCKPSNIIRHIMFDIFILILPNIVYLNAYDAIQPLNQLPINHIVKIAAETVSNSNVEYIFIRRILIDHNFIALIHI